MTKPSTARRPRGTGTISVVDQRGAWRFKARFPDGVGGVINVGTFDSEERAHAELNALVEARRDTQFAGAATSLRTFGADWIERYPGRNRPAWRSVWRTVVERAPFIDWPLDAITKPDVRDWVRTLPELVSERTGEPISRDHARNGLGRLRLCLAEAVEDGRIAENPAAGVKLPEWGKPAEEPWTFLEPAEIRQLLEHPDLPAKQRVAFGTAIYQGLRQGELCALDWRRVDWTGRTAGLDVLASWDTETKTRTSRRRVPFTAPGRALLEEWWRASGRPRSGPVFPSVGPGSRGKQHARGYDFGWAHKTEGARPARGNRAARPAVTTLGWKQRVGLARRVRFHDLRHTCASALISGYWGDPWTLADVAAFLGHSHQAVTAQYAHLDPRGLAAKAARTGLQLVRAPEDEIAQLREIIGQAVRDSNSRPLAPENKGRHGVPRGYEVADRSRTGSPRELAIELARGVAEGRPVTREEADALATQVLTEPGVALAGRLVEAAPEDVTRLALLLIEQLLGPAPRAVTEPAHNTRRKFMDLDAWQARDPKLARKLESTPADRGRS